MSPEQTKFQIPETPVLWILNMTVLLKRWKPFQFTRSTALLEGRLVLLRPSKLFVMKSPAGDKKDKEASFQRFEKAEERNVI